MVADRIGRLVLERKPGEAIVIASRTLQTKPKCESLDDLTGGEEIVLEEFQLRIRIEKVSGQRVKLIFEAPNSMKIWREELLRFASPVESAA